MGCGMKEDLEYLAQEIEADIHHGECFYEQEMYRDFIAKLNKMKKMARKYYQKNVEELKNDE